MNWPVIWRKGVFVIVSLFALGIFSLGMGDVVFWLAAKVHPISYYYAWIGGVIVMITAAIISAFVFDIFDSAGR